MFLLPLAMFKEVTRVALHGSEEAGCCAESHSGVFVGVLESRAALLPGYVPGLGFAIGLNPHVLIPLFSMQGMLSVDLLGKALMQMFPSSSHFLHLGRGLG